jgi:hypothetical protein
MFFLLVSDRFMYFLEVMDAGSCDFFGTIIYVICNFSTINIFMYIDIYMHYISTCVCKIVSCSWLFYTDGPPTINDKYRDEAS